jgi:hypothetical protein
LSGKKYSQVDSWRRKGKIGENMEMARFQKQSLVVEEGLARRELQLSNWFGSVLSWAR